MTFNWKTTNSLKVTSSSNTPIVSTFSLKFLLLIKNQALDHQANNGPHVVPSN